MIDIQPTIDKIIKSLGTRRIDREAQQAAMIAVGDQLRVALGIDLRVGQVEAWVPERFTWVDVRIKCDAENNPPDVLEQRQIVVNIYPPELLTQENPVIRKKE
jgi:hypothetical protein